MIFQQRPFIFIPIFKLILVLFLAVFLLLATRLALAQQTAASSPTITQAVGDPLPRIVCAGGFTAEIYAEGLTSPDGIAFNSDGVLYVSEESIGQVTQIGSTGVTTPVLTGLQSPEGLAFDSDGNLYLVEDRENGRLIKRTPAGVTTTLASTLKAPEGVVAASDGNDVVYVTESNAQYVSNPLDGESHVTAVSQSGMVTRLITMTPQLNDITPPDAEGSFSSLSGLTLGSDGLIYVANELSGVEVTTTSVPFPYTSATFTSTESIYNFDPANPPAGDPNLFTSNLVRPEGVGFGSGNAFPLYVAEEDSSGEEQNEMGRLSTVASDGSSATLCTGFSTIEDVVVAADGAIFVTEDLNGLVIRLSRTDFPLYLPLVIKE